jgi:CelD/BcsL family acetyltransferase involved in cellulose biosynthesis
VTSAAGIQVEVAREREALAWLDDSARVTEWEALTASCRWSTVYQSTRFARVWYGIYAPRYEPIVVVARDHFGTLVGLLPLARERATGALVHVGSHHAEYQTWILSADDGGRFVAEALQRCHEELGATRLQLLFVAPRTPVPSAEVLAHHRLGANVRIFRRGLMAVGPDSGVHASLRKKSNKSRLKRLEKLGPLTFRQLQTRAELEEVIDRITEYCDVRQGAVNATTPFLSDPLKRPFYLAMMAEPGMLHATVLEAGGHVVASHIGFIDGEDVALGIITHSPMYAEHSPGKLLLLFLGRLLGEQGFSRFDLTPGGSYKDRFATDFDEVHAIDFFMDARAANIDMLRRRGVSVVKTLLERFNVDPKQFGHGAGALLRRVRRVNLRTAPLVTARLLARRVWSTREYRLYRMSRADIALLDASSSLRVNELADLLCYRPVSSSDPPQGVFLRDVLARLEAGQRVYTLAENGRLLHYSWVIPSTDRCGSDFGHEFPLTPGSTVLWDDYTDPYARGRGLHQLSLRQRLADEADRTRPGDIVIGVGADNGPSRHNIEKVGFRHFASCWLVVRLGKEWRWVEKM